CGASTCHRLCNSKPEQFVRTRVTALVYGRRMHECHCPLKIVNHRGVIQIMMKRNGLVARKSLEVLQVRRICSGSDHVKHPIQRQSLDQQINTLVRKQATKKHE